MRVVIADDAVLVRRGIAGLLTRLGVDVVAEASDALALHEAVVRVRPDVAIVDIRMPPTHTDEGVRAAYRLRREVPSVAVLLLSQYVDAGLALRLLEAQEAGTGYLLKERVTDESELVNALQSLAAGGTVIDPGLVAELMAERDGRAGISTLTTRERAVLELIAQGRTDKAIAERLLMSQRTVEVHVHAILRKLDIPPSSTNNRRVHAVLHYLREHGGRTET